MIVIYVWLQPKYPQPMNKLNKQQSSSKIIEGMEALRQIATTSLFLENEQNNAENNRIVPTIKEPDKGKRFRGNANIHFTLSNAKFDFFLTVEFPLEMRKLNDPNIEICSISDDDEFALELTTKQKKSEPSNSLQIDLGQPSMSLEARATSSTAFANTEAQDTSIQLQQQRPSKLLRSRAPVNQSKPKDDDLVLIETSLMILDDSPLHSHGINQPSTSLRANLPITTNSSFTSRNIAVPSTSSGLLNLNHQYPSYFPSTSSILQPSTSKFARESAPVVQDGSATLLMVQPAIGSASSTSTTTEPELVLSPAKLGQWIDLNIDCKCFSEIYQINTFLTYALSIACA